MLYKAVCMFLLCFCGSWKTYKALNKKYKAYILKYVPYVLK